MLIMATGNRGLVSGVFGKTHCRMSLSLLTFKATDTIMMYSWISML